LRVLYGLLLAVIVLQGVATAQVDAAQSSGPPPAPNAQSTVLHANAQRVVLDVVVRDKNGNLVSSLKPSDFVLTEDKTPQTILQFEEHPSLAPVQQGPALPTLSPGTFTDFTPVPPDGTLNILLFDALNTPANDPSFMLNQLQQYVAHANPKARITIFGLANRLILLQGFTSNPNTLKSILNHQLIPRSAALQHRPGGSAADQQKLSGMVNTNAPSMAQLAANLQQFEAQTASMETDLRVPFTLDAFNTLGHYLSAFPGRKNLVWFSGTFPINLLAAPALKDLTPAAAELDQKEFREATDLLSNARVAVYPIDARSMMGESAPAPVSSGHRHAGKPVKYSEDLKKFSTSKTAVASAMNALATETGGSVFDNSSNLADAVANVMDAGANYYSLVYTPTNDQQDGAYREIRVSLAGNAAASAPELAYRQGYYAEGPAAPRLDVNHDRKKTTKPSTTAPSATAHSTASAYEAAAMSRGAPQPQNLLFKVRVLPASNDTESSVAPDNTLDPIVSPKGPFQRYDIDYVALPRELTLTLQPDGNHTGHVEFLAYVFDLYGRLLNATGKTFLITLTPANYDRFLHSAMACHLEISVPISKETFLRIGMRDIPSDKFGVVEVPTADVSHLAPATYPAASPTKPATAPSTPPTPRAAPSTPPPS